MPLYCRHAISPAYAGGFDGNWSAAVGGIVLGPPMAGRSADRFRGGSAAGDVGSFGGRPGRMVLRANVYDFWSEGRTDLEAEAAARSGAN